MSGMIPTLVHEYFSTYNVTILPRVLSQPCAEFATECRGQDFWIDCRRISQASVTELMRLLEMIAATYSNILSSVICCGLIQCALPSERFLYTYTLTDGF